MPCFPIFVFPLQGSKSGGRVEFDGTNYYIFIFDFISSQQSAFLERPLCLYFTAKTSK